MAATSAVVRPALKPRAPSVEIVTITPQMAHEWLKADMEHPNRHNRTLKETTVHAYARDMQGNNWLISDSAICFDTEGVLINGQHRLHACVLADAPFQTVVMRGMARDSQEVMDQGTIRRPADILGLRGHTSTPILSSAARALLNIKDPAYFRSARITSKELTAVVERHPKLQESLAFVNTGAKVRSIPISLAVAIHYIGTHLLNKPDDADAFVKVFKTGVPTYVGDPVHKLRERLLVEGGRSGTAMRRWPLFYSVIRAWNGLMAREELQKFQAPRQVPVFIDGLDPDLI